jgi:ketosteroid isomerase-like protein
MKLFPTTILLILVSVTSAHANEAPTETCQPFNGAALEISEARARFNNGLNDSDIDAVEAVLADNVILITGTDSDVFIGREAQVKIWKEGFVADAPLAYVRTPSCILVSGLVPAALERGSWRGAKAGDTVNHISGDYSAKWREVNGQWVIEVETYLTTNCGGSFCKAKAESD